MAKNQKTFFAFTLIELLVVIVIIGILGGIIFSAVRGAIDSAKTMACMNNLRQIYVAIEMYAQDHDGYWIACEGGSEVQGSMSIWNGTDKKGIGVLYNTYLDDLNIYYCPANDAMKASKNNFLVPGKGSVSSYYSWTYSVFKLEELKNSTLAADAGRPHKNETKSNKLYGDGSIRLR